MINTFINRYKNNLKINNEINVLIRVDKEDINREIYFLDNNGVFFNINNNDLHKLNKFNTEIYINDKLSEYNNYFTTKEEGKYKIKLKIYNKLTDCSYMFSQCKNIIKINFISFNICSITNMNYMFSGCHHLINISNLSSFDTKKVNDMSHMFGGYNNLKQLNLSSFDTKNITNLSYMFYKCNNLKELNLSSFDTKNVTNMSCMFSGCNNLKELNLSSFDTNNVTNMSYMFSGCNHLKELNLSSFDTKNVTNMSYMFYDCKNLKKLNLSSFDTKNVTNVISIFYNCPENIINSNLSYFKQFNIKYLQEEINNEVNILIEIKKKDINKEIYFLDNGYEEFSIKHYAHDNIKEFNDLNTELYINNKKYKYNKYFIPEKEGKYEIKLKLFINLINTSYMFVGCKNITDISFISFNTRYIINMKYMFYGCNNLKELNLSSFDTKNVINMQYMFSGNNNLENLNLSTFDSNKTSNASGIFYNCPENIINSNLYIFKKFHLKDLTRKLI